MTPKNGDISIDVGDKNIKDSENRIYHKEILPDNSKNIILPNKPYRDVLPSDIELQSINIVDENPQTQNIDFSLTEILSLDSQNNLIPKNDDISIDAGDKNIKDKVVSESKVISQADNLVQTDTIFSISDKREDMLSNPLHNVHISVSEEHKTKENIISVQIPLDKNMILHVTHFKDKPEQIGINLEPAGLGKAELIIENHDNMVTAIIRSDKIEVLDLIRKEAPSLERHLNNSGLNLTGGSLRFEHGGGGQQQNPHAPPPQTVLPPHLSLENIASHNELSQTVYQKLANITSDGAMDMRL